MPVGSTWLKLKSAHLAVSASTAAYPMKPSVIREVNAWQAHRNDQRRTIEWTFTRQDADRKMSKHYVSS